MSSRAACFWATACIRGCSTKANYQSTTVHLPVANATGNLDIITDAHAREVLVNEEGKAKGVLLIDKKTGQEERVKGKVVVLAASSGETVRIMLNSKSNRFPDGLANSTGLVGKYIMDTVGTGVSGQVPALESVEPHNEDGAGGSHVYSPWWLYKEQLKGKLKFSRGYHIEMGGSRRMPGGKNPLPESFAKGAYGSKYKQEARRYYGSFVGFSCRGEMIPNEKCYAELDGKVKDKWGIPVVKWHWEWTSQEIEMAKHAQKTFANMIDAMGGKVLSKIDPIHPKIDPGGSIIHEVGGAIMGENKKGLL